MPALGFLTGLPLGISTALEFTNMKADALSASRATRSRVAQVAGVSRAASPFLVLLIHSWQAVTSLDKATRVVKYANEQCFEH